MTDAPETCAECGFDSAEWNDLDARRTIGSAGPLFALWTERMTTDELNRRPSRDVWSALEYVDHTRETLFGLRLLCEVAIDRAGTDLGPGIDPSPPGAPRTFDGATVLAAVDEEATTFAGRLADLAEADWTSTATIGGAERSVRWATRHAVHDLWHHLVDIAAGRVAAGDATPSDHGGLEQINSSAGGVPKLPVAKAEVGRRGLVGDQQNARLHHGRPWQALCLWSADVIDELRAEGHPISAGSAGENLTLRGLDWERLRAGTILEIGEVRCQLSAAAVPCTKNAQWFSDRDFNRIHHDRNRAWTRWYASVLRTGAIRPGDQVRVVA